MPNLGELLIIAGPTACGKSEVALKIAAKRNAVIINADSKQVYKELPIITAQPTQIDTQLTPHHLYGYVSVEDYYSVTKWLQDITQIINNSLRQKKLVIVVGGTGMYINALLHGFNSEHTNKNLRANLEEELRSIGNHNFYEQLKSKGINLNKIHHNDSYRLIRAAEDFISITACDKPKQKDPPQFQNAALCLLIPNREVIYKNINKRFVKMLNNGLIDEINSVKNILHDEMPATKSHGVREMLGFIHSKYSLSLAIEQATRNIRNYAKRQITWFKNQCKYGCFFDTPCAILQHYK